jgi:D-arabinose 1-dehydrogenase-like Zn-dependent alcohol dehydrogenase
MRAMVLEQPAPVETAPLRLVERPRPDPCPGEVRVRVHVCGICRTDLHVIEGDLAPQRPAIVPGHQVVGVVDACGAGCTRLAVGQRVGLDLLRLAAEIPIRPHTVPFDLADANQALRQLKHDGFEGAGVLRVSRG